LSFSKQSHWQRRALTMICVCLLASCNDTDTTATKPLPTVTTPSVVGLTQAAATTAITGAGLTLGVVTTQSSATVPSGSVVSQSPAAGVVVATGAAVNVAISSGAVAVPNVVGLTQSAAATALTGDGLTLGTVTLASSASVPAGSVISQTPAAGAMVASPSAVNLSVSVGPAASYAYVANAEGGTISAYSINAQGQLAALAISPISVPGSVELLETKIDPSGQYLYVVDESTPGGIYAFAIQTDGSLQALNGGAPYPTGNTSRSLAFDATGTYLYVLNVAEPAIISTWRKPRPTRWRCLPLLPARACLPKAWRVRPLQRIPGRTALRPTLPGRCSTRRIKDRVAAAASLGSRSTPAVR
jgi:hypothetical protein